MDVKTMEDYTVRISSASPLQLVIINYEIIMDYIKDAKKSTENEKDFSFAIERARRFLNELRNALDLDYKISFDLMALYNYIDQQLSYYLFNKKAEHAEECEKLLGELLDGWKTIQNKEEDKTPIMENAQQVYAGLTYGRRGNLTEYVDTAPNRGFKA